MHPHELFTWQPKANVAIAENHPRQKLKQIPTEASINGKLKTLSPEKLEELQKFMDGLVG